MSTNTSLCPKIFLLSTTLPVNLIMTRNAVCTATQIAEILSFNKQHTYELEVAIEEAFSNAVQHFSKDTVDDERIYIDYTIENSYLVISLRENGIPFDLTESDKFTPDSIDGMEKPGFGTFLIEQSMDSVEYFVHGRDGKETLLKKKISNNTIPEQLVPTAKRKRGRKRKLVTESTFREAKLSDLPEICRLAWRCYGYTQEELLYDLELLTKKFKSGEVKPIIFFDSDSGNMIAHEALKYHDLDTKVSELGLAFIDPSYRCPRLTEEFAQKAREISRKHGDQGMFDCSVTTHIYSQKAIQDLVGSTPCGIFIGIAAAGMEAKELTTTKQEKGTVVNHYYAFDKSEHTIYTPERHHEMIKKIYGWLELPREYGSPIDVQPKGESSVIAFPLPEELNVSFIIVNIIGTTTVDEVNQALKECKGERKDAVYMFIPLGVASSPYLVERCEELGFSFAGIMPHIHNGDDRVLMQWVNIDIDYDKIKVYGKKSAELLAYIIAEKERIENQL